MPADNPERIRVRTITITAPQQLHRIGARCLTQAKVRPGANLSSTCSKAIRRLQLGCKKPRPKGSGVFTWEDGANVDHGILSIDNDAAERAVREIAIAIDRRNCFFGAVTIITKLIEAA